MATSDKYDRQLRLWGANGQRALGETTVVLLRASAAGTETLKNLVLPGIGRIVVVDDDAPTTSAASNFFTPASKQEQPRAQIALETLQELNPDVHGEWKKVNSITEWTSVLSLDGGVGQDSCGGSRLGTTAASWSGKGVHLSENSTHHCSILWFDW